MANVNKPFGLRPVRHIDGSPWNGAVQKCYVGVANATALFVGDPVVLDTVLTNKDPLAKLPTVIKTVGTTGVVPVGVIVAIEPNPADLSKIYLPTVTVGYVWVAGFLDPTLVYQIQDDGSGTPTYVFPGQNAEMAAGSGGSTVTGLSSTVLDASTPTTTQAHTLHIIGLSDIPNNELADYAVWDVMLNTVYNATGLVLGVTSS